MSKILSVLTEVGIEEIDLGKIDLKGFCDLLSRMSVELALPDDARTLLYSGGINGKGTLEVVKNIEGVRLIRDTALSKDNTYSAQSCSMKKTLPLREKRSSTKNFSSQDSKNSSTDVFQGFFIGSMNCA